MTHVHEKLNLYLIIVVPSRIHKNVHSTVQKMIVHVALR